MASAALVLLAHAALLQVLPGDDTPTLGPARPSASLSARQVLVPPPRPSAAQEPAAQVPSADRTPAQAPAPAPAPAPRPVPVQQVQAPASSLEPSPLDASAAPAATAEGVAPPASAASIRASTTPLVDGAPAAEPSMAAATPPSPPAPAGSAADAAAALPTPLYSTQPAPAATMVFDLKRGLVGGQATLQWQPAPGFERYVLTLQAQAFGVAVAGWNSSGSIDATGLAPDRYVESRRAREVRATNFQRSAGKVSFSAQGNEYPLTAGMQDRSSWMLQLGAVLNANPAQAQPGAQTTLVVVGTRGAPEPWVFTVVERAPLTLGNADTGRTVADAVQLLREPRHPYDTRARIWLDPAHHHLPLKVQLLVQKSGEGQEFELRSLSLP